MKEIEKGSGKEEGRGRSPDLPFYKDASRRLQTRFPKFMEGYHFVTLVIHHRVPIFQDEILSTFVLETLNFYKERGDYKLIGFIIMPEHVHFICIPSKHISEIVRDIKKYVAKKIIEHFSKINQKLLIRFEMPKCGKRKHIYQIWQSDFYDFNITTEKKLLEKLNYMYENPLRKGLCKNVLEYKFSDASRYFGSGDPILPTK